MVIVGCDFHTRFQQITILDPTTGELLEHRSEHQNGDVKKSYGTLTDPARVGVEATMNAGGSSESSVDISTNYGSETRWRFVRRGYENKRPTREMPCTS